jgi:2-phosphosulfolactate phosphatase
MQVDVALVPSEARDWPGRVCVVIDELRASSTLTTLLDLGCPSVLLTRSLDEARRLGRERGALLAGERHGLTPRGFDFNNSPVELSRADVRQRPVVLCTSNGTRVLGAVRRMPVTLVGCLLNAGACADTALELALARGLDVGIVCAGTLGRFALDDAFAAGEIVGRIVRRAAERSASLQLSDAALASIGLRSAYPDATTCLEASTAGQLCRRIGAEDDIAFCARTDAMETVPLLAVGSPLSVAPGTPVSTPGLPPAPRGLGGPRPALAGDVPSGP